VMRAGAVGGLHSLRRLSAEREAAPGGRSSYAGDGRVPGARTAGTGRRRRGLQARMGFEAAEGCRRSKKGSDTAPCETCRRRRPGGVQGIHAATR